MRHVAIIVLTIAFALFANAAEEDANSKREADPQDGQWKPISAVLAGKKLPKLALDAITLKVSGKNYEVTAKGEQHSDKGTRTLDITPTPKRITINSRDGANKGKAFLGIYEMKDANSMRVCYDLSGTAFPTNFESTDETGHYLVEYQRVVAKTPPKATDASEDTNRQNGFWKPAGAMLGGRKLTKDELNKITLTLKDGTYEVLVADNPHADKGTIALDTSVSPNRMTIQIAAGPNKGKTILAIYEMGEKDGVDTFRICYDLSGKAFPTDFSSPKGSMHYLVGYRRLKDSKQSASQNSSKTP